MAGCHQMGHHSNNLIDLPDMAAYAGAIFSPINGTEKEATAQINEVRNSSRNFEIVLDPQLYVPASERGKLKKWPHFPKDVDTADLASSDWWSDVNKKLAEVCKRIRVDSVCSPLVIPRVFDDKYYSQTVKVGAQLCGILKGGGVSTLQTVLANLSELANGTRPLEIASIVSGTAADRIYLVLANTTAPRDELSSVDELSGAMRLINALERHGMPVTVGFCSTDILLWKTAGASACASGKFFNLRRFTRQRFEESVEGGGQLPYWFEEGVLAFLRLGDLLQIRKLDLLSDS